MNYYHTCSYCGANLDPGEKCDCNKNKEVMLYEDDTKKDTHPEFQRMQR